MRCITKSYLFFRYISDGVVAATDFVKTHQKIIIFIIKVILALGECKLMIMLIKVSAAVLLYG